MFCIGISDQIKLVLEEKEKVVCSKRNDKLGIIGILTNKYIHFFKLIRTGALFISKYVLEIVYSTFYFYSDESICSVFFVKEKMLKKYIISLKEEKFELTFQYASKYGEISSLCVVKSDFLLIGTTKGYIINISQKKEEQIISPDMFDCDLQFGVKSILKLQSSRFIVLLSNGGCFIYNTTLVNENFLKFELIYALKCKCKDITVGDYGNKFLLIGEKGKVMLFNHQNCTLKDINYQIDNSNGDIKVLFVSDCIICVFQSKKIYFYNFIQRSVLFSVYFDEIIDEKESIINVGVIDYSNLVIFSDLNIYFLPIYQKIVCGHISSSELNLFLNPNNGFCYYLNKSFYKIDFPVSYIEKYYPIKHCAISDNLQTIAFAGKRGVVLYSTYFNKFKMFGDLSEEKQIECLGLKFVDDNTFVVFNKLNNSLMFYPRLHLANYSLIAQIEFPKVSNSDGKINEICHFEIDNKIMFLSSNVENYFIKLNVKYGKKKEIKITYEIIEVSNEFKGWISPLSPFKPQKVHFFNYLSFLFLTEDNKLKLINSNNEVKCLNENVLDFWIEEKFENCFFYFTCIFSKKQRIVNYYYNNNKEESKLICSLNFNSFEELHSNESDLIPFGFCCGNLIIGKNMFLKDDGCFKIKFFNQIYLNRKLLFLILNQEQPLVKILFNITQLYDLNQDCLESMLVCYFSKNNNDTTVVENFEKIIRFFQNNIERKLFYNCLVNSFRKIEKINFDFIKSFIDLTDIFERCKNDNDLLDQAIKILVMLDTPDVEVDSSCEKNEKKFNYITNQAYELLFNALEYDIEKTLDSNFFDLVVFISKVDSENNLSDDVILPGWLNSNKKLQKILFIDLQKQFNDFLNLKLLLEFEKFFYPNFKLKKFLEVFYVPFLKKPTINEKEKGKKEDEKKDTLKDYFFQLLEILNLPSSKFINKGLINKKESILAGEDVPFYTITQYYVYTNRTLSEDLHYVLNCFLEFNLFDWALLLSIVLLKVGVLKNILRKNKYLLKYFEEFLQDEDMKIYKILFKKINLI